MRLAAVAALLLTALAAAQPPVLVPQIDGAWWVVARQPDLGPYTTPKQQPVDFAVWQAADGTWQLWSCIRATACGGRTRLLHRWQGKNLTDSDWPPMGVAMQADPGFGETPGGLQAPFAMKLGAEYFMFYGDWVHIALARGVDGKTFARQLTPAGVSGMFGEGPDSNARDPMVLRIKGRYHCYYTAHPNKQGSVYCRTSSDLRHWSTSKIVAAGGDAGTSFTSAECPFVLHHQPSGHFYLFRTQRYGRNAQTSIYRSKDPLNFGVDDDRFLVGTLPIAAPEILEHQGQQYIAALRPGLDGIQIARLKWTPKLGPR